MKAIDIRFFAPEDNQVATPKNEKNTAPKKVNLTGYISSSGKLVFPAKTMAALGIDVEQTTFKIGMVAGKRKATSIYLVEAAADQADTFPVEKGLKVIPYF